MIHVCFGLYDADGRYSKFTGTTITSIFANTRSEVTAHILHDNTLTSDNREKFLELAARHNQRVNFYNVDELCPDELKFLRDKLPDKVGSRFSIGTFYRLLAKKILPVDRIIYLDSDIIVNLDLAELWQTDLKNFSLAAVPEIDATHNHMRKDKFLLQSGRVRVEDYFCAGVLIFDLNKFDENFFADGVQFLVDNPQCKLNDQDILNGFFSENYLKLDAKFNSFVSTDEEPVDKKIYHYAGHRMDLDMKKPFSRLWMENFLRSGWLDVDSVGRLYEEFGTCDTEVKTLLMNLSAGLSGRKRAFVTFAEYVNAIKKFFAADDKELIVIEKFKDFDDLTRAIKKLRSKCVFLSMVENFPL